MKKVSLVVVAISAACISAFADNTGFQYAHEHQPSKTEQQSAQKQYNPMVNAITNKQNYLKPNTGASVGQQITLPRTSVSGNRMKSGSAQ
jgi:hypothetical protein